MRPASSGRRPGAALTATLRAASGQRPSRATKLWERFDEAVAELDRVSEGRSLRAVARAYAELSNVVAELAKAVEREDRASGLLTLPRARRAKSSRQR